MGLQEFYEKSFELDPTDLNIVQKNHKYVLQARLFFTKFIDSFEKDLRRDVNELPDEYAKPYFMARLHRARLGTVSHQHILQSNHSNEAGRTASKRSWTSKSENGNCRTGDAQILDKCGPNESFRSRHRSTTHERLGCSTSCQNATRAYITSVLKRKPKKKKQFTM